MILKQVVIVIPFYKESLSYNDEFSLACCMNTLGRHPIVAIKPSSLDLTLVTDKYPTIQVVNFEDRFFKNINGYNELVMSTVFYKAFLNYEYLLIYQLDAFVFSDTLSDWCNKNYDYIGAPWLYPTAHKSPFGKFILHCKSRLYKRLNITRNGLPNAKQMAKVVGNGGLSLRKVKKFHDLCIQFKDLANAYISKNESEFNEDIFWSVELNRKKQHLSKPHYKTALRFSIETLPELAIQLNHKQLPFGCHAWDKHLDFWKPILQKFDYKG